MKLNALVILLVAFDAYAVPWSFNWTAPTCPPTCVPTTFVPPPSSNLPSGTVGFDVLVHEFDGQGPNGLPYFEPNYEGGQRAHHDGMNCINAADPAYHGPIIFYPDTTFVCATDATNAHLMTFANGTQYAATAFIPDRLVDFSGAGATISWRVTTLVESGRDWWDFTITPWDDNLLAHDLDEVVVDGSNCAIDQNVAFTGPPRNAITIIALGAPSGMGGDLWGSPRPGFCKTTLWSDFRSMADLGITPSSVRRDRFDLVLSTTHITLYFFYQSNAPLLEDLPPAGSCLPQSTNYCQHTFVDQAISPPIAWTRGVLQWIHHSYNPSKGARGWGPAGTNAAICGTGQTGFCDVAGSPPCCKAGTWHWSDLSISNAVPFTITQGNGDRGRWISAGTANLVTFPRTSGTGAVLRFFGRSLFGSPIQYSLDNETTWTNAVKQAVAPPIAAVDQGPTLESYWTPIPAGYSSVRLRGTDASIGVWWIRNITLWQP